MYIILVLVTFPAIILLLEKRSIVIPCVCILSVAFANVKISTFVGDLTIYDYIISLYIVFSIVKYVLTNKLRLLLPPLSIGFIIFLFFILVSFINALSIPLAITGLRIFIYVFAFYLLCYSCTKTKRNLIAILWSLVFATVILGVELIVALYSQGVLFDIANANRALLGTGWIRSNTIAAIEAIGVPLAISLCLMYWKQKKIVSLIMLAVITLQFTILIMLSSRGALIACLLGFIVFAGLTNKRIRKNEFGRRNNIVFSILFVLIGILIISKTSFGNITMARIFELATIDKSGSGRVDIWLLAWTAFKTHPVFGVGIYNLGTLLPNLDGILSAHNFVLEWLATIGLLGCIFFIGLLLKSFVLVMRRLRWWREPGFNIYIGIISSMIVVVSNGLVEPTLTTMYGNLLFWGLVGASLGVKLS
jgi:O-antigen ligase